MYSVDVFRASNYFMRHDVCLIFHGWLAIPWVLIMNIISETSTVEPHCTVLWDITTLPL